MDYLQMKELYHHGIKGQKWGDRRYQYEDGSLTPAGKERYLKNNNEDQRPSFLQRLKEKRKERERFRNDYYYALGESHHERMWKHIKLINSDEWTKKKSREIDKFYNRKDIKKKRLDYVNNVMMKKYGEENFNRLYKKSKHYIKKTDNLMSAFYLKPAGE